MSGFRNFNVKPTTKQQTSSVDDDDWDTGDKHNPFIQNSGTDNATPTETHFPPRSPDRPFSARPASANVRQPLPISLPSQNFHTSTQPFNSNSNTVEPSAQALKNQKSIAAELQKDQKFISSKQTNAAPQRLPSNSTTPYNAPNQTPQNQFNPTSYNHSNQSSNSNYNPPSNQSYNSGNTSYNAPSNQPQKSPTTGSFNQHSHPNPSFNQPSNAIPRRTSNPNFNPLSSKADAVNTSTSSLTGYDATNLASKFPLFNASEISAFHQQFSPEGEERIHVNELASVSAKSGHNYQEVMGKIQNLHLSSKDGYVDFEGFLTAISKLKAGKASSRPVPSDNKKITLYGAHENTTHTINEDEKESFVEHINYQLSHDKDIGYRFPIETATMQIFAESRDGLVLAKLINDSVPGTIDERALNLGKKLSPFQIIENNNVVINSAKAIGCSVVNIGSQDLMEGREHLILGLIWQIIRAGLVAKVDIRYHPELFRLLEPGETLEQFLKLPTDKILFRWFNYHLKKAGWHRTVNNFNSDVKDGENYTILLNQLSPSLCSKRPLNESDLLQRAELILQNAERLGCRKYLTPKSLVAGNSKLNFAFVANLFNTIPGLDPLSETEKAQLDDWLFGSEGDRESRAFALWLNSLGVDPFVNNLYDSVADGTVLLQAISHIQPELVDWKKVNKTATTRFKQVENSNYVIAIGRDMNFTLVGIQGSDITDGIKNLTLGFVWQLMRQHVIQTLKTLSKAGRDITDADIIRWANETAQKGGKPSRVSSFKDSSLRSGVFFLDIINGMKPGVVDYSFISRGNDDESVKMNAKYAISIARKLGATIFVLPEDIMEVKPKMILTFVGALMALDKSGTLNQN